MNEAMEIDIVELDALAGTYYILYPEHPEIQVNRVIFDHLADGWYKLRAPYSGWEGSGSFDGRFYTGVFKYGSDADEWEGIIGRHFMETRGFGLKVFGINDIGHSGFFFYDLIRMEDTNGRLGTSVEEKGVGSTWPHPGRAELFPADGHDIPEEARVDGDQP